jgi:hypothetical protein
MTRTPVGLPVEADAPLRSRDPVCFRAGPQRADRGVGDDPIGAGGNDPALY